MFSARRSTSVWRGGCRLKRSWQRESKVGVPLVLRAKSMLTIMCICSLGLESCPFCEYCEVPRTEDKLFQCRNPECNRLSCRECREANHLPLRCEEHAMKQRLLNYVEAKMTDALIRECPACRRKFVKSEGCNKMVRVLSFQLLHLVRNVLVQLQTCVCGAIMCYICRQQINGYNHFSNVPPNPTAPGQVLPADLLKCPLYSDTAKLHQEEVEKRAAEARAELASSNPNIRVDMVLSNKK